MLFVMNVVECLALFNYKLLSLNKILCKSVTSFTLIDEYFNPTVLK